MTLERPRRRARTAGALLAPLLAAGCSAPQALRFEHAAMGTRFSIVVHAADAAAAEEAARAAFARVDAIEAVATDFDPASELMRLSRASELDAPTPWLPLSRELAPLLAEARAIAERSGGAFDPTLGPLTRLWRRSARQGVLPTGERLARARAASGWWRLEVDSGAPAARLLARGMRLDLGGIAKGAALDAALAVLVERGFPRALVDGGGDVRAGAPPPGRDGWRIRVAPRGDARGGTWLVVAHAAVATSGDAERTVTIDGRTFSHVVDPATGLGTTRARAATVVAPSGARADAWATALVVLGPDGLDRLPADAEAAVFEGPDARPCTTAGFRDHEARPPPRARPTAPAPPDAPPRR